MGWTVYQLSPLDLYWEHVSTVNAVAAKIASDEIKAEIDDEPYPGISLDKFMSDFRNAKKLASEEGWEGDFRHSPGVFWLPDDDEAGFVYGFVWKQDNNGTTFVVSPRTLPWPR